MPIGMREVDVRLEIESGDVVVVECAEPIGQVTPTWTDDDFARADPSLAHALSGAIYVKGARPGDTLEIDILKMEHKGWGWSGLIPEFGLLADDFDSAHLHHWEARGFDLQVCGQHPSARRTVSGVIGVAPRERGRLDGFSASLERWQPRHEGPRQRLHMRGSRFTPTVHCSRSAIVCFPPREMEVCGSGVESPMTATIRLSVRRDLDVAEFQARRRSGCLHCRTQKSTSRLLTARTSTRTPALRRAT